MNSEFEQKLSRRPLREIPGEWRGEILSAARAVGTAGPAVRGRLGEASPPKFRDWLSTIFWPHPTAWAGLAAIWVFIFAVNFSDRDQTPAIAEKSAPPSPEMITQLRQQQRMLAELIGPRDTREAERQKNFVPGPRSEYEEFLTA
jgi:hypothetical protein